MKYLIDNNSNYTLLTLLPPNIPASICTAVYNVRVNPFVPKPVRCFNYQKFGHGQAYAKDKSFVVLRAVGNSHVKMITDIPIVANPI